MIPCTHCLALESPVPFLFALEKCQQAAALPNNSFVFCPNGKRERCVKRLLEMVIQRLTSASLSLNHPVGSNGEPKPIRLDLLAPDLAMVHLSSHKIKKSDLRKEPVPLGEGTTDYSVRFNLDQPTENFYFACVV